MSVPAHTLHPERAKSRGVETELVWYLIVLAGLLFVISLIPLPPNDFWWHLKIGEEIFTNHTIPTSNMYAWTLPPEQPFFYGAWLSELLFYIFYRIGNVDLLTLIRTILIGITFCLIGAEAHRRCHSWRISALVIAILGLMSFNNLIVRTQIWAWLPFVLTYLILMRISDSKTGWRWLVLCPICMIFWVNTHGSFILGVLLPGAFLVGAIISRLLKQEKALDWRHIGYLGGALAASGLAILINPRFAEIINYTVNLLTNPPSQKLIEEWQSPTPQGIANITFYVSILILIIALAYSRYRLKPTEIILAIGFLWLAWSGQRYVVWYGIVTMPILAHLIKDLPIKFPTFVPQKNWLNLGLAVLLFIPAVAVQPWFVEQVPLPQTYWQQVLRRSPAGELIDIATPVTATEYLVNHPGGKLFNEMGYGSYLIWALPGQKVFIDPRVELYPYDQWMDYIDINNGRNYDETLARYGVDRILLDKKLQTELSTVLSRDRLWMLEYENEYSQLWVKASNP